MTDISNKYHQAFEYLGKLSSRERSKFYEQLLFAFTIAGRAIWSDDTATDEAKLDALKWLNELTHRVWNIHIDTEKQDNGIHLLREVMNQYAGYSQLLQQQLIPSFLLAFDNFQAK